MYVWCLSFYITGKNMKPQEKVIPNNTTYAATITELRKYYQYTIQVLAYTRLGDGALSTPPLLVQTHEDGQFFFAGEESCVHFI